ncbi:MAG TPA: acyl-CoA dehydrogenase family protein [Rhizomicrobium sp.]|jgi:pimeloyl-CoA dehydrogenase small subunit|nr:acyl-CoA dehydrogenase family protein [Rhizomicrobium sp.]
MDFDFSEEQKLLRDTVARFLGEDYDFETFKRVSRSEPGWRPDIWNQFAELGLLGASLPEAFGGLGGGAVETMIVMEEFGKTLVVEPYVPTVVIGGGLLRRAGTEQQKQEWLPKIAAGETLIAFAFAEPHGRYNLADLTTKAKKRNGNYVLNGQKAVVLGGPWADVLVVTARTSGSQRDASGVSLFLVDKKANGISTRDYPTMDGLHASEIVFENVEIPASNLVGAEGAALPLIELVADEAIAAHCAEAIGCMKVLLDATVEYSRTRKQFGVPIGKFQVLQHRMVDMFMAYEQSVSITLMATLKLDDSERERKRAVSAAKVHIGKAGRFVGQQAVQIHGGMGMTDELNVGHYVKRLTMLDVLYGDVQHHLKRYAALG